MVTRPRRKSSNPGRRRSEVGCDGIQGTPEIASNGPPEGGAGGFAGERQTGGVSAEHPQVHPPRRREAGGQADPKRAGQRDGPIEGTGGRGFDVHQGDLRRPGHDDAKVHAAGDGKSNADQQEVEPYSRGAGGSRAALKACKGVSWDRRYIQSVSGSGSSRPGIVIGKRGAGIETIKKDLQQLTKNEVFLNIVEVRKAEIDAQLVAENIATQLERRIAFRRAMKKAIQTAMKFGAKGIRVAC